MCARCGDSLDRPAETGPPLCRACRLAPPPFVRAIAYGPYESRLKDAIHALKYGGLIPASAELGRRLAEAIARLANQAPAEMLVIPVPLHTSKQATRGFNQAGLLARHALQTLRRTHPSWRLTLSSGVLVRQRATGTQAGLTPRQRRLNVRGAFRMTDPAAITGKHVLVVDDILTTGATARAASQALLDAGAESVWVATLARARRISPIQDGSASLGSVIANGTCPAPRRAFTFNPQACTHHQAIHLLDEEIGCRWEKP